MFNVRRLAACRALLGKSKIPKVGDPTAKLRGRGKGKDDTIGNAADQIGEKFANRMPEDPLRQVSPKKIVLLLTNGSLTIMRNERLESVYLEDYEEGWTQILKGHRTDVLQLRPGLIKLEYNEERTDLWYHSGGYCFIYHYGPMHLNLITSFKVEELDKILVDLEMDKLRGLLKHKDDDKRASAEIGLEFYEPLAELLDEMAFAL